MLGQGGDMMEDSVDPLHVHVLSFLTADERNEIPDTIRTKVAVNFEELTQKVKDTIAYEGQVRTLEGQLKELREGSNTANDQLNKERKTSEEYIVKYRSSLATINQIEASLQNLQSSFNEASLRLETLTAEKDGLVIILDKRIKEIEELNDDKKNLADQLHSTTGAKVAALFKVDEFTSQKIDLDYREKELEKEREWVNKQVHLLNIELDRKSGQIVDMQREYTNHLLSTQAELTQKSEEIKNPARKYKSYADALKGEKAASKLSGNVPAVSAEPAKVALKTMPDKLASISQQKSEQDLELNTTKTKLSSMEASSEEANIRQLALKSQYEARLNRMETENKELRASAATSAQVQTQGQVQPSGSSGSAGAGTSELVTENESLKKENEMMKQRILALEKQLVLKSGSVAGTSGTAKSTTAPGDKTHSTDPPKANIKPIGNTSAGQKAMDGEGHYQPSVTSNVPTGTVTNPTNARQATVQPTQAISSILLTTPSGAGSSRTGAEPSFSGGAQALSTESAAASSDSSQGQQEPHATSTTSHLDSEMGDSSDTEEDDQMNQEGGEPTPVNPIGSAEIMVGDPGMWYCTPHLFRANTPTRVDSEPGLMAETPMLSKPYAVRPGRRLDFMDESKSTAVKGSKKSKGMDLPGNSQPSEEPEDSEEKREIYTWAESEAALQAVLNNFVLADFTNWKRGELWVKATQEFNKGGFRRNSIKQHVQEQFSRYLHSYTDPCCVLSDEEQKLRWEMITANVKSEQIVNLEYLKAYLRTLKQYKTPSAKALALLQEKAKKKK